MKEDGHGNPDDINARTKRAISYVEQNSVTYDSVMEDSALEQLSSNEDAIINYKESPLHYFTKKGSEIFCMCVNVVDNSRKWIIKQTPYKGEYIEYLD